MFWYILASQLQKENCQGQMPIGGSVIAASSARGKVLCSCVCVRMSGLLQKQCIARPMKVVTCIALSQCVCDEG